MPDVDLPEHLSTDITIDSQLVQMAREAVAQYIQTRDPQRGPPATKWAVKPSQIKGLRQVADNQPGHLLHFVEKQLEKATSRIRDPEKNPSQKDEDVVAFWTLIQQILQDSSKQPWALAPLRQQAMPAHLQAAQVPKGAKLSREEQEARQRQKEERSRWEAQWNTAHIPHYFRSFCIDYLYRMYKEER